MIFEKDGSPVTQISWVAPTQRVDGSTYGESQHAGYELGTSDPNNPNDSFNSFVSIPATYGVTSWGLDQLNIEQPGLYECALRTVATDGTTSEWSVAFTFKAVLAAPKPPTGLVVS